MTIKTRPLKELCSANIERINPASDPEKEFWYVDISSIDTATKNISTPTLTKGKTASVRARQVIHVNDVLVSTTRPNLNAVALVPQKYDGQICSTGFCVLRCGEELDPDYLFQFSRSSLFVNSLSRLVQGALYPAVTDKQVLAQFIPWVSIEKQRKIAARLKAQLAEVDKARHAAETQLRDADLLNHRIFKKIWAELDSAPKKTIDDYAETGSGSTPARGNKQYWQPAEVAWVKTAEVAFAPITNTEEAISQKALTECSLTLLPPKTILIAMYGQGKTRGQSAILEIPAATNQACFAILPNDSWEPEFLFHWLRFSYKDLRGLSEGRGGNQANLNGGLLKALQVPAPSKSIQKEIVERIVSILNETDTIKYASMTMLNGISLLPRKIMAQAFGDIQP